MGGKDFLDMHASCLRIDGEFHIIDAAVGDPFLRVFGNASRLGRDLVGGQLCSYLFQRKRARSIVLEYDASVLQNKIVRCRAQLRSDRHEKFLLRLIRSIADCRRN